MLNTQTQDWCKTELCERCTFSEKMWSPYNTRSLQRSTELRIKRRKLNGGQGNGLAIIRSILIRSVRETHRAAISTLPVPVLSYILVVPVSTIITRSICDVKIVSWREFWTLVRIAVTSSGPVRITITFSLTSHSSVSIPVVPGGNVWICKLPALTCPVSTHVLIVIASVGDISLSLDMSIGTTGEQVIVWSRTHLWRRRVPIGVPHCSGRDRQGWSRWALLWPVGRRGWCGNVRHWWLKGAAWSGGNDSDGISHRN